MAFDNATFSVAETEVTTAVELESGHCGGCSGCTGCKHVAAS
jgi:hypothetical protein